MEDVLDDIEESINFMDNEVFIKIWTSPRKVLRYINDTQFEKHRNALLVLIGIVSAFDRAVNKSMGETLSLNTIIILSIIVGFLFGWLTLYLYSSVISWTGKWLKGKGDTISILRVMTYGLIPYAFSIVFLILQMCFFGDIIFKEEYEIVFDGIFLEVVFYGLVFIEIAFGIWGMALAVIGVSEVQKFGIGKSLLNLLISILVIFVPIIVVVFAIMGF